MSEDLTDLRMPIKLKTLTAIICSTAIITATILGAWYSASNKSNEALNKANEAMSVAIRTEKDVKELKCLTRQLAFHQMYKKIPTYSCEQSY